MMPRMRPSSTRKSMPSSATVVPKAFRRPRASMHAISSALLFFGFRFRLMACGSLQKFFRCHAEPLNGCGDPGPFFGEELLVFDLQQEVERDGRAALDETSTLPRDINDVLMIFASLD